VTVFDRAIARTLPAVPRVVVERLSRRYIAGPTCADALRAVRELDASGKAATIDVLGEAIATEAEAEAIADAYREVLDQIGRAGLDATVSVKLSGLGLELGLDVCRRNLEAVVRHAAARGTAVTIDMEDSSTTDATLALYRGLRELGLDNVGIVLQARLRRTVADARAVADLRPRVRLCKGIYLEPPAIAYQDDEAVRASFLETLDVLLSAGCYAEIATHDEWLVGQAKHALQRHGVAPDGYEFQMLLGVRRELGDALVRQGHRLRVYVPFGEHWYEYSLRRLQENPKVAGHIARDTLTRVLPVRRRVGSAA
jgi:proline dehydrogenase